MPIVKLTPSFIANELRCPDDKPRIEFCDSETPGLYVLVSSISPGRGTYFLRYKDHNRKTCHQKIGRTSDIGLADARKAARTLRAELVLGRRDPRAEPQAKRDVPTFAELFDEYIKFARPRKRSWRSDETLYRVRLQSRFGSCRVDEISRKDLIAFHSSLLEEHLAPATADHYLKLVRRMCSYGCELGLISVNPAARFPLFNRDNKVNHYLNDEELRRLLTVLHTDRNRTICRLVLWLLAVGCRYSEAINAKWKDVDRKNRRWFIAQENSKNKRSRWAGLSDMALQILDELGTEGEYEYLFVNRSTGRPYVSVKKVWERLRAKAELRHFRLHDCRHQFASMLANRGVNLLTIKEQLGHADVRMTASRYSHIAASTLASASNVAVEAMRDAMRDPTRDAANAASVTAEPAAQAAHREAAQSKAA